MSDQTFTTVYNSISLIDSSSKPKGPPKIITLPIFPTSAPDLPEKIKEIKDKPVLTDGTIESTAFGFFLSETKKDTKEENPKNEDTSGEQENNPEEKKKEETGEQ